MSTSDAPTPQVQMVEVKRYDVTLSLADILAPLTQTVGNLQAAGMVTAGSEVAQHLQTFNDLVTQLHEVVGHINSIDPTLLASSPDRRRARPVQPAHPAPNLNP
jgi:hypothetical protein